MKIEFNKITVRELFAGYADHDEDGVVGYSGKLDIRPPYQREFVYDVKQRNKVIDTVRKGYPLNVMYWVRNPGKVVLGDDSCATFEVLDGQQRTLSICQYVEGRFSIDEKYFDNLPDDLKEHILGYELTVYVCEGPESEKLDWFRTVNIAGAKLTEQELLNATFTGPWLAAAKRHFSKTSCPAYQLGYKYLQGTPIRQDYLETTLDWISSGQGESYMAKHQHNDDAEELWVYFQAVIDWVKRIFPDYHYEMKSVGWGHLYNKHKDSSLNPSQLKTRVVALMADDDVTRKSGIYPYVLTGEERQLSLRAFTKSTKREAYTRQGGKCAKGSCQKACDIEAMEGDHITPWSAGGKTIAANCQMLCKDCNRRKSGI